MKENLAIYKNTRENVVSLDALRANKTLNEAITSYQSYLQMLELSQILSETKGIVRDIQERSLEIETIRKAESILSEISKRTQGGSPAMAKELKAMGQTIQAKLQSLQIL